MKKSKWKKGMMVVPTAGTENPGRVATLARDYSRPMQMLTLEVVVRSTHTYHDVTAVSPVLRYWGYAGPIPWPSRTTELLCSQCNRGMSNHTRREGRCFFGPTYFERKMHEGTPYGAVCLVDRGERPRIQHVVRLARHVRLMIADHTHGSSRTALRTSEQFYSDVSHWQCSIDPVCRHCRKVRSEHPEGHCLFDTTMFDYWMCEVRNTEGGTEWYVNL
jgi:hypothetical protein